MANVISNVAPVLYKAARMVPRELTGFIGACNTDFSSTGQAAGDTVKVPVSPVATVSSFTASQTFSAGTDRTPTTKSIVLTNEKVSSWNLTAEQELSLMNSDVAKDIFLQTVSQHLRAHVNAIETHVGTVAKNGSSRATGAAATTPFASTLVAATAARKILIDNGCPVNPADVTMILDTTAGTNLRNLTQLTKSLEAGTDATLRAGTLGNLFGMAVAESAGVATHTAGTGGTSYAIDNVAGYAVGATAITLEDGSGTILAGDILSNTQSGRDANQYVVNVALGSNIVTVQEPGLKVAWVDEDTTGLAASYTANIAMHRNAITLIARPGLQPQGGGIEQMTITDPQTGLSFLLVRVAGNGMASWYVRTVYEASVVNGYGIATILG